MKNLLIILLFLSTSSLISGQSFDQTRMEKYWRYRENFNKNFNVRSPNVGEPGVNIPAVDVFIENGQRSTIDYGDHNVNLGHYYMLLATEYKVLKNSDQSYQNTLAELYTALLSFERLDEYSEAWVRYIKDPVISDYNKQHVRPNLELYANHSIDANGWIIRGDPDSQFFLNYQNQLSINNIYDPQYNASTGEMLNTFDGINSAIADFYRATKLPENISQDMIINILPGLALIKKVIEVPEFIGFCDVNHNQFIKTRLENQGILNGEYVDFDKWMDNIVTRFMSQLKHPAPHPIMPYLHNDNDPFNCATWTVDPCWDLTHRLPPYFHKHCSIEVDVPFCDIIETRWYLRFPPDVFPDRLNFLGNGDDFDTHFCFSNGLANAANKILNNSVDFHGDHSNDLLQQNIFRAVYNSSTASDIYNQFYDIPGIPVFDDPIFHLLFQWLSEFLAANGGYKTRVMATVFDFDNLIGYANSQIPYSTKEPCEQLPLIWYYLHGASSSYSKPLQSIYEDLLVLAPCNGCRNYPDPKGFNAEWSSNSRFVNAHERTTFKPVEKLTERSGMDFMIAHNLYALVYNKPLYHLETDAYQTTQISVGIPNSFIYNENGSVITSTASVSVPTEYTASKAIHLKPGFRANMSNYYKGQIGTSPVGTSGYSVNYPCISIGRMAVSNTVPELPISEDGEIAQPQEIVDRISLYPNPNSGRFSIKSKEGNPAYLYSTLGSKLLVLSQEGGNYEIDLKDKVVPGIYQVVFGDNQHITISVLP